MRRILFLVSSLLLFSACAAPATSVPTSIPTEIPIKPTSLATSTPQITATPVPFFTVYGDEPIVSKGQPGTWDDRFTDPGAVIYHDGMFHMFRNGFRGFPAESQVGYVTSPDGYTWTKQGNDPVLKTKDVPYAKIAMYASSVIHEDNCWALFFYTWDSNSFPGSSVIGRAGDCIGGPVMEQWFVDTEPILQPGADGAWDDKQVLAPHVLKTDNGYIMYYSGVGASGIQMIGMATSKDEVHWTKYNDPATTDTQFADSDPVFQPGEKGAWDAAWVQQPRVFQTADGWIMIYRGVSDSRGANMKLGLATSKDGIHWERYSGNPIFKPSDIKGSRQFWFTNVVLKDDVIYLFVEGDISQTTQIYLATHEGTVKP
ncbi:MAG TPA: hypothetical protein VN653_00355 [Anaerolineales bacterium]|nr:hypothetical protein [Anaerolineales bacterium]